MGAVLVHAGSCVVCCECSYMPVLVLGGLIFGSCGHASKHTAKHTIKRSIERAVECHQACKHVIEHVHVVKHGSFDHPVAFETPSNGSCVQCDINSRHATCHVHAPLEFAERADRED